jgi:hypothetical protein
MRSMAIGEVDGHARLPREKWFDVVVYSTTKFLNRGFKKETGREIRGLSEPGAIPTRRLGACLKPEFCPAKRVCAAGCEPRSYGVAVVREAFGRRCDGPQRGATRSLFHACQAASSS